MYWEYQIGPVYQLTITHNPLKEAPDSIYIKKINVTDTVRYGDYLRNETIVCEKISFLKKDSKEINSRTYAIASFISPCSRITDNESIFFTAQTVLKNRHLNFIGECSISDTAGFIENMYKTIFSVKIEEK